MSQNDENQTVLRNRARQIEWYGEPLGVRFRRLLERLEVSQAGLAEALGLSAPMLSQLMSGHRAKISNPAVFARLVHLERIAADPRFHEWGAEERQARVAQARVSNPTTSNLEGLAGFLPPGQAPPDGPGPADPVAAVRALLLAAATPEALEAAAARLDDTHPALAELLRAYGTGDLADARTHYARTATQPPATSSRAGRAAATGASGRRAAP